MRDDKDAVMDMLFAAFEKHQYYNIRDLVKITRQPIVSYNFYIISNRGNCNLLIINLFINFKCLLIFSFFPVFNLRMHN